MLCPSQPIFEFLITFTSIPTEGRRYKLGAISPRRSQIVGNSGVFDTAGIVSGVGSMNCRASVFVSVSPIIWPPHVAYAADLLLWARRAELHGPHCNSNCEHFHAVG